MECWQIVISSICIFLALTAYTIGIVISIFSLSLTYKIYKNSSVILNLEKEFDVEKIAEINNMMSKTESLELKIKDLEIELGKLGPKESKDPHSDQNIDDGFSKFDSDMKKDIS